MEPMLVGNFMEKAGVLKLRTWSMISRKRGCFQEFPTFCRKKGGKMQGNIHGKGLILSLTD